MRRKISHAQKFDVIVVLWHGIYYGFDFFTFGWSRVCVENFPGNLVSRGFSRDFWGPTKFSR